MTLDANILIAYLDGEEKVVAFINEMVETGRTLFLPAAVEIEVLSFSRWTAAEVRTIETFFERSFVFVSLDRDIARLTAEIRRTHKIKTPDATIVATALFTSTPLLTRNVRDFASIPNLVVWTM